MHALDHNGKDDGQYAYADEQHKIYNCNIHHKQMCITYLYTVLCMLCIAYFLLIDIN